jgi:hypothetical protein
MTDEEFVKSRFPNADSNGYPQVQWDGVYYNIRGIPGFRSVSYLGERAAWKAARVFIETGVQWACGIKVPTYEAGKKAGSE